MVDPSELDIILTTWEGGGNFPPVIAAARLLIARGHNVRIMSDAVAEEDARSVGAEFRPWYRAPSRRDRSPASDPVRDWDAKSDLDGFIALRDRIMCQPALCYARDLADELRRRPADIIVSNEMLFGVMVATEAARAPLALLCPNISLFPLPGLPPMGRGLRPATNHEERAEHERIRREIGLVLNEGVAPVNEARAFFGLSPIDNLERQVGWAERILLATSPAFDFRADFLPSKVRYIGPLLEEPTWAKLERNIEVPGPSRPSILVAFSSTFQGQLGTIQNVATALGQLPVTGLITLGPALVGAKLRLPPNVIAVDCASHEDIMARATVVVTHGGHGTVIRALAHRVPLLCLPMGRDQHDNAIRVTERGAGLTLDRDSSPDCIRHALTQLIEDERFARAAQAFACRLTDKSDVADLVGEIEALALSWQGRVALERSACGVRARKKEASV